MDGSEKNGLHGGGARSAAHECGGSAGARGAAREIGCAVCGFSVGIMWPGTFSKAAVSIKGGGTALFALLALAGDLGCSGGPTLAGLASSAAGGDLHKGIFAAVIFPTVLLAGLFLSKNTAKNELKK